MTSLGYSRDQLGFVQPGSSFFPMDSALLGDVRRPVRVRRSLSSPIWPICRRASPHPDQVISGLARTMRAIGWRPGIFKPSSRERSARSPTAPTPPWVRRLLRHGQRGRLAGPHRGRKAPGHLLDLSFKVAAAAVVDAPHHDLLLQGAPPGPAGGDLGRKFRDMRTALSDLKFSTFLCLLGSASGSLSGRSSTCAPSTWTRTSTPPGSTRGCGAPRGPVANFFSQEKDGVRRVLGRRSPTRLHHHDPAGLSVPVLRDAHHPLVPDRACSFRRSVSW